MNKRMPKSVSKHIRQEKARIRRENSDPGIKEEMIKHLYAQFNPVAQKETTSKKTDPKPKILKTFKKAKMLKKVKTPK